ncbi:MAG: DUF4249 domain-containing protein [Ginsengibacter sp.]
MRRFKIQNIASLALFIFLLFGCKKVIDVNLKNAGVQTVITGEINNRPGPYIVKISKTINFSSDNVFPPVSGAFVTISGSGITDTLTETNPGTYTTHKIRGKSGEAYNLYVSADGKVYTASSTMPERVPIDSLSFLLGRKDALYAVVNFQDPEGIENYYQFIEYVNGEKLPNGRGNSVFSDRLSDGRYISRVLYDDSSDIKAGTTLTVQMNCIDKSVYNYLNELQQISGSGSGFSSQAPANPTSNITGGALGYFSANTISTSTVNIP